MIGLFTHVLIVLVPLLITSVLHMVVVKEVWFRALRIPIWQSVFGENKTWRGVIFVPTTNAIIVLAVSYIVQVNVDYPLLLGYFLGLGYLMFELPNSFLKRMVGIQAGGHHETHKYLFYFLDKTDSAFGVTLIYTMITGISIWMATALFVINSLTHVAVALILVRLKIKSSF